MTCTDCKETQKSPALIFINWRGGAGVETIDSVDPAEFPDMESARREASRLICEYALAGMPGAYQSSREAGR